MKNENKQNHARATAAEWPDQKIAAKDTHLANEDTQNNFKDPVRDVRELVGEQAVLIPIPVGQKGPKIPDWQKITLKQSKEPEHEQQLRAGNNIGVLLGKPSGGLCAIDIDDDEALAPFLDLNPDLKGTLRTHGARGAQIWMKIGGDFPALGKIKTKAGSEWGEWRADGGQSVIYGTHPTGVQYQIVQKAIPLVKEFGAIKWPDDLNLPWVKTEYDLLVEEEGEPFLESENGTIKALNHMFFVEKYVREHVVLYDSALKEFFSYDPADGLWKRTTTESAKKQILNDFKKASKEFGARQLLAKRNDSFGNALVNLLKAHCERFEAFGAKHSYIHVKNGILQLNSTPPRMEEFSPEFYSRNLCPFNYEPDAKCEQFLNELLKPALGDEDIDLLQRWAGSVLIGQNPAQRILLVVGTAGGGKSTVMSVIELVIGLNNVAQLRTEHLADRFELFRFDGKTLLTGKDVAPTFLMRKGAHVLKSLVGDDVFDAEKKGANERIQLRGNYNVAITCNTQLKVLLEGDAGAWKRRLLILHYEKPKPKIPIADFAHKLIREEGAGILTWMVAGAQRYMEEIENHGGLQLTKQQQARIDALLSESDSIRSFVEFMVVPAEGETVTSKELLNGYVNYCTSHEWEGYPEKEVERKLPTLMYEIHKVKQSHDVNRLGTAHRGYKGFTLAK